MAQIRGYATLHPNVCVPSFAVFASIDIGDFTSHLISFINMKFKQVWQINTDEITPVASLGNYSRTEQGPASLRLMAHHIRCIQALTLACCAPGSEQNSISEANFRWATLTSAYWAAVKVFCLGASLNPYPGRLTATTWKLGCSGDVAVSRGRILRTSKKLPGPCRFRLSAFDGSRS